MMTITLLAKKGGVGKSTVCLLLHEAFKKAGKTVAIQDWDAQGTSSKALAFVDGQRAEPNGNHDILLIDTPPNLEHHATAGRRSFCGHRHRGHLPCPCGSLGGTGGGAIR